MTAKEGDGGRAITAWEGRGGGGGGMIQEMFTKHVSIYCTPLFSDVCYTYQKKMQDSPSVHL